MCNELVTIVYDNEPQHIKKVKSGRYIYKNIIILFLSFIIIYHITFICHGYYHHVIDIYYDILWLMPYWITG